MGDRMSERGLGGHSKQTRVSSTYKWIVILMVVCQVVCNTRIAAANVIKREGTELPPSPLSKDSHHQHTYGSSYESILDSKNHQSPKLTQDDHKIDPLETAASYHHAGGGKGWMDMGAWAKEKGAFGWYADFPVGKG